MEWSIQQIAEVLAQQVDEVVALSTHLSALEHEQHRLARQIAAVTYTIDALKGNETLMAEAMFDGFDHTQYRGEVEDRWGNEAYASSDAWWRGLTEHEQVSWQARLADLNREWIAAANDPGITADSPAAQALAVRHVSWLRSIPGTPAADPNGDLRRYVRGLAEMYVSDERFSAHYGGVEGAAFVRNALNVYLDADEVESAEYAF